MIQAKMNVLEKVGLSESNLSDNAQNSSFHSKVNFFYTCMSSVKYDCQLY